MKLNLSLKKTPLKANPIPSASLEQKQGIDALFEIANRESERNDARFAELERRLGDKEDILLISPDNTQNIDAQDLQTQINNLTSFIRLNMNNNRNVTVASAPQKQSGGTGTTYVTRLTQTLVAGNNTFSHPVGTAPQVMVQIFNAQGEMVLFNKVSEGATTVTVKVLSPVPTAQVTIIGN
jgi:hypothetical protein